MQDAEHLPAIIDFIAGIGLAIRQETLQGEGFLPGILIERGGMRVDPARLLGSGDLLHEAGHLAVTSARLRPLVGSDAEASLAGAGCEADGLSLPPDAESMAMAWSFAAAVHLGIPPEVVFLEGGYNTDGKGGYQLLPGFKADTRDPAVWRLKRAGLIHTLRRGAWRIGIAPLVAAGMTGPPAALSDLAENGLPPFPIMSRWLAA